MKNIFSRISGLVLILLLVLSSHACIDLEEDVSTILSIENLQSESDVEAALSAIYRTYARHFGTPHKLRATTYGSDDLTTWWAGNKAPLRVFDRFDYGSGENSDNLWMTDAWSLYWEVIYYTNTLIEGLKTATASEDVVMVADGEARFFRAMAYFDLVRMYGGVPLIQDGTIPTGEEERMTVLESYLFIENDLKMAVDQLPGPGEVKNIGRVSSAAARTLLADLYLTWGGWPVKDASKYPQAAAQAKQVIDLGYYELLDIDKLWLLESQNSNESVFSFQYSVAELMDNGFPESFSFHEARGWSDAYPELQFFYDFPEGPRKDVTFVTEIPQRGVSGGVIIPLDPPTKPWQESQRMHPMYGKFTSAEDLTTGNRTAGFRAMEVFRYAEVLLIYAEAQARTGENAASIEALNQVKRRAAGLPYLTPDPSVDVTTATPNEIIDERGWELAGEHKRWFDLIRSERLEEIAARRDPAEQVQLLRQPTKAQYIAPIPADAFQFGSVITQNPEGFKIQ